MKSAILLSLSVLLAAIFGISIEDLVLFIDIPSILCIGIPVAAVLGLELSKDKKIAYFLALITTIFSSFMAVLIGLIKMCFKTTKIEIECLAPASGYLVMPFFYASILCITFAYLALTSKEPVSKKDNT